MAQKVKSGLITALKIAVAVGLIWWLLASDRFDFKRLQELFQPQVFVVCVLLLGANLVLTSERWRGLLRARGFQVDFLHALRYTLIGSFFNFVIPGGVGGDVVKSYYVARENPTARLKSVMTIAMDRLLGLFSMLFMALAVMMVDWDMVQGRADLVSIFQVLSVLFVGFMVGWSFVFSRRMYNTGWVQGFLKKFPKAHHLLSVYESFSDYRHTKVLFFQAVVLSFLAQTLAVLFCVYAGSVFGFGEVSWKVFFFVVPIGLMITAIPISPAGIGVGQMAFYFLFNLALGENTQLGPLIISAMQIFNFLFGLLGAFFYVRSGHRPKVAASSTLATD